MSQIQHDKVKLRQRIIELQDLIVSPLEEGFSAEDKIKINNCLRDIWVEHLQSLLAHLAKQIPPEHFQEFILELQTILGYSTLSSLDPLTFEAEVNALVNRMQDHFAELERQAQRTKNLQEREKLKESIAMQRKLMQALLAGRREMMTMKQTLDLMPEASTAQRASYVFPMAGALIGGIIGVLAIPGTVLTEAVRVGLVVGVCTAIAQIATFANIGHHIGKQRSDAEYKNKSSIITAFEKLSEVLEKDEVAPNKGLFNYIKETVRYYQALKQFEKIHKQMPINAALKQEFPDLAKLLLKVFRRQHEEIVHALELAIADKNRFAANELAAKVKDLESSWNKIMRVYDPINTDAFCLAVTDYLDQLETQTNNLVESKPKSGARLTFSDYLHQKHNPAATLAEIQTMRTALDRMPRTV